METAVWILSIIVYISLFTFVYNKQKKAFSKSSVLTDDIRFLIALIAIFAPLVIIGYAIRAVFFEDWL